MDSTKQVKKEKPIITMERISKTFQVEDGEVKVIDQIDLDIRENEFLVLFGAGQCGKTTLLKMLAGLETISGGSIKIDEKELKGFNPKVGMVYQTTALFPWLTVMGNVEFGPKARGIGKTERQKKAQYYIDLVGLTGFEKHFPSMLSGGMQQRVGIARAYCNDPEIILMDEPFGHLDAQTRYMMEEEVEKIWQEEKRTIIFVTNNIEEALYLADRIVILTECPARVLTEYKIDIPRPRSLVSEEFLSLREEISSLVDLREGGNDAE
ncbi:MAG: ABC transporter ATP-binding protein [Sphaerochaetaceae bacterium]|nr:ABC transporter ATP-binding protein [Sphaerochaetaceae bacterium]